jgi:hypothetical protein
MIASKVVLDCDRIKDWRSFHEEFARVFGFPDFYGKNMNAWMDCLSDLDDPGTGMTGVHCERGSVLALELLHVKAFRARCPELYDAIVECAAFVNWRRLEVGQPAVLALSLWE